MSTARLTFLYPHLLRAARLAELAAAQPAKTRYRSRPCRSSQHTSSFSTSARRRQAPFERHGSAVEPLPVAPDVVKQPKPDTSSPRLSDPLPGSSSSDTKKGSAENGEESSVPHETDTPPSDATKEATPDGNDTAPTTPPKVAADERMQHSGGPMDAVLHMPPPDESQHPHISKPTYVHHFDSYSLVKELEAGGYTQAQAITLMKAIRAILAQNLDVAQESLVGKSDVDNVGHDREPDDSQRRSFVFYRKPIFFALRAPSSAPRS